VAEDRAQERALLNIVRVRFEFEFILSPWIIIHDVGQVKYYRLQYEINILIILVIVLK
jgi:hypothetical protein